MNRIAITIRVALTVVLLVFGMLGVTNSVHTTAKIVYAVLIALAAAGLALQARRTTR